MKVQTVSHTEFDLLKKDFIPKNFFLVGISLLSTPRTVLGNALRVECELVNVCACLNMIEKILIDNMQIENYRRKCVHNFGSLRAQPLGLTVNGISNNCNRPYLNA